MQYEVSQSTHSESALPAAAFSPMDPAQESEAGKPCSSATQMELCGLAAPLAKVHHCIPKLRHVHPRLLPLHLRTGRKTSGKVTDFGARWSSRLAVHHFYHCCLASRIACNDNELACAGTVLASPNRAA